MSDTEFAKFHQIPLSYAFHYRMGRRFYDSDEDYTYPRIPSPEQSWFFAGYADSEQENTKH